MKYIMLLVLVFLPCTAIAKKKLPPKAPLPAQVAQAQTVFLQNGGGSDLAYDTLYQQVKEWGRYKIVGSPGEADIIISIRYWGESHGSTSYGQVNPYTNSVTTTSSEKQRHYMGLAIIDPKTNQVLWDTSTERKLVVRWHVEDEIVKTASSLVNELKSRTQP